MKFATWCICWPMLGLLWVCATIGDSMTDACDALDGALERLEDYLEAE